MMYKAADMIRSYNRVPCTGCAYCLDGCPAAIAIPEYFEIFNSDLRGESDQKEKYRELKKTKAKASDCVECGQCESICPQHIHVIDELKALVKHFEI